MFPAMSLLSSRSMLSLSIPLRAARNVSRVICNGEQQAEIGQSYKQEKNRVEDKNCDCRTLPRRMEGGRRIQ